MQQRSRDTTIYYETADSITLIEDVEDIDFFLFERESLARTMGYTPVKNKDKTRIVAIDCEIKVVKNKLASPFSIGNVRIKFGKGFDKTKDLFNVAKIAGYIKQKGSSYKIKTGKKTSHVAKGESSAIKYLEDNEKLADKMRQKILKAML